MTALLIVVTFHGAFAADPPRGDPAHGEAIYNRCIVCSWIDRDRTGPRHAGLIGVQERVDLIAFLKAAGAEPQRR